MWALDRQRFLKQPQICYRSELFIVLSLQARDAVTSQSKRWQAIMGFFSGAGIPISPTLTVSVH